MTIAVAVVVVVAAVVTVVVIGGGGYSKTALLNGFYHRIAHLFSLFFYVRAKCRNRGRETGDGRRCARVQK